MSSWERHLTFQDMLQDNLEPEHIDDIDLEQQWEKCHAEEQAEELSAIQSYMENKCHDCSFGKGSQQCENCYVGGY